MRRTLPKSELTLAILAGGAGKRLGGTAKGLLTAEGVTFIERVLQLGTLCAEAMIVSADPAYDRFGVRRVVDVEPGRGAPGGVVTALLSARTPWVLVVACDMPFVTVPTAQALIAAGEDEDVTCFEREGELEPLLAIYRASLGALWRPRLGENPSLRSLLADRPVHALAVAEARALDSINTPEQLAAVKS
ncbi:MAG: mobA [Myxococcaceae bacterium]|nr:mobA [Myxococcaceae bacterium]